MALPQVPTIPVSKYVKILTAGYNDSAFNADVGAAILAEYNSKKRAIMKQHYRMKAERVGLSLEAYCYRFGIRGIV